jgi:hypothetical protein
MAFEHGDARFPYVLALGGTARQAAGKNERRTICARSSAQRTRRSPGRYRWQRKIQIIDKSGKNSLVFDTAKNTITISSDKDITLRQPRAQSNSMRKRLKLNLRDLKIEAGAGAE